MTALCLLLLLATAAPDEKPKKGEKPPAAVLTPAELMAQAEAKITAGDVDGGIELLRKATEADTTGEASLRLGRVLDSKLDLDGAMDAYAAAAAKLAGPAKGEALGRLAVAQEIRARPEATATAEAALAADGAGAWPAVAAARARARAGKPDEALALAQKAEAGGLAGPGASARGLALERKGDLAGAEAAYRSALETDPINAPIGLARVLRQAGRAAEAEPLAQKVIASAPGAIEAYKESARAKIVLGRPEDALGDAATAAAMAEGDADARQLADEVTIARALAAVSRGQIDGAIRDLTALRDLKPEWAPARVGLGKALIAKRQGDAALAELTKAVQLSPDSAEANYQLGLVTHRLKGNPAGALGSFEKAAAAEPQNTAYREALGGVLVDAKQYDKAVAELTKVTQSPSYAKPDAWVYLGASHLATHRYKDAVDALEKALTLGPASAQVEGYLAWSYFGLKDAANFKLHGAKARELGYKDATFLSNLSRVEKGEPIK